MSTEARWVGSMPEVYDRVLVPILFSPFAPELAARAAATAPRRVLELAAGTGVLTAELVQALPEADLVATDLNPAMVAWAAERVVGPTWRPADAQSLDLAAESVDLVVCQFGVMFFPDKAAAFSQAARVLAPGGTLLFSVWDTVAASPLVASFVDSLAVVLPEDPPTFVVRVPHGYADPARITADLQAGGLDVVGLDRLVLRGHAPSARALAEGICRGTPLRFVLEERGDLDELTQALGEEMTTRWGAGPMDSDLAAYVVSARTPA